MGSQRPVSPSPMTTKQRSGTRRLLWARLLALAVSVLAALALGELGARLAGIGYGHAPMVGHAVYHHWHEPSYEYVAWGPYGQFGGHDVRFNGNGLAMRAELPSQATTGIVCLGDSFTEAVQVAEEDRYSSRLGDRFDLPVLNFGCSSFSPTLSRLALESHAGRLAPRLVLVQLYANDIQNEIDYARAAKRDSDGRIARVPGERRSQLVRLARRSHLARVLRTAWLSYRFRDEMELRNHGHWGVDSWSPYFERSVDEAFSPEELVPFRSGMSALARAAQERGWDLRAFVIPERGALKHGVPDHFASFVAGVAAEVGIPWIDVSWEFAQHDPATLFFPVDIHLTPKGHAVLTEALSSALAASLNEGGS